MSTVIEDGGFAFRPTDHGWKVFLKRKELGELKTHREGNGRHCFRLGLDTRPQPRTYRGKVIAANALKVLADLLQQAQNEKLGPAELIVRAWEQIPSTVAS